ncbi:HIT family protein [Candidatus Roizmanbacteria bacterium CG10_big_fil_rev_8_21_14_0_10_39_6]|uniref:HIT family protein n=1 Tax=Candidatus Roizmanbacteria bacterium CG10_big_fil_rev_8_21_14_0_10_39_6 TaxID=1974853 RepID=A0A2M8KS60_9BACT|nr:MAG: HIT family protein [Candidatus Roizmanbacteria bacterium CG10_big_fil_rev_8_21_14_0_10_39_6]
MTKECIFCKIVKHEIPSFCVYEDMDFFGFLDIRPLNLGNSLLIPKKHYQWVYDVPNFGYYWEIAKKISLVTQSIVKSHSINFLTLGYEVPHAHIRIIPRFDNDGHTDGIRLSAVKDISNKEMQKVSKAIYEATTQ